MKKNDVFSFKAPNGAEVTGVVIMPMTVLPHFQQISPMGYLDDGICLNPIIPVGYYLCYAQNRIIVCKEFCDDSTLEYEGTVVDYATLPDYDEMLARYNDIEVAQAETAAGM